MTFKHGYAWFLLLILSLQWIGGIAYVKFSYGVIVARKMDSVEAGLAEKMASEHGVQVSVKVLNQQEQEAVFRSGYGAPFLFSTVDADSTYFFTVEDSDFEVTHLEFVVNGPEKQQHAENTLLSLSKLFSPYPIGQIKPTEPLKRQLIISENFLYNPLKDLFHSTVPTPPPSLVG